MEVMEMFYFGQLIQIFEVNDKFYAKIDGRNFGGPQNDRVTALLQAMNSIIHQEAA